MPPRPPDALQMAQWALDGLGKALPRKPPSAAFEPNPGPQTVFYETDVHEVLYGGAAGGGKSLGLVAIPLRWSDKAQFNALVLRRETTQLDDLLGKARQLYRKLGAAERGHPVFDYRFPSGARVKFAHCKDEADALNYQGAEFQFIGFDELTHFTERQYREICSRLRSSTDGLPRAIRATTNPGGPGHEWVFKRWRYWLDPDAVIPGRPKRFDPHGKPLPPAEPGEALWILHTDQGEEVVPEGTFGAHSRTFIPARLSDNPKLLAVDPTYGYRLRDNDAVRRRQLEEGDWLAKPGAGTYFQREWFDEVRSVPDGARRCRAWDFAATRPSDSSPDPDWTRGVLVSFDDRRGIFYIEHLASLRDTPAQVEQLVERNAKRDGTSTLIRLPQDPGAAGISVVDAYTRLLRGYPIQAERVTGDKVTRARIASAQAERGNIRIVRDPNDPDPRWIDALLYELEQFDGRKNSGNGYHDDIVDALSDAITALSIPVLEESPPPPPPMTFDFSSAGIGWG